jgi:hypothetical protein
MKTLVFVAHLLEQSDICFKPLPTPGPHSGKQSPLALPSRTAQVQVHTMKVTAATSFLGNRPNSGTYTLWQDG